MEGRSSVARDSAILKFQLYFAYAIVLYFLASLGAIAVMNCFSRSVGGWLGLAVFAAAALLIVLSLGPSVPDAGRTGLPDGRHPGLCADTSHLPHAAIRTSTGFALGFRARSVTVLPVAARLAAWVSTSERPSYQPEVGGTDIARIHPVLRI